MGKYRLTKNDYLIELKAHHLSERSSVCRLEVEVSEQIMNMLRVVLGRCIGALLGYSSLGCFPEAYREMMPHYWQIPISINGKL